ncbi:kinesin-like protein [Pseudoscourfieldia marina]
MYGMMHRYGWLSNNMPPQGGGDRRGSHGGGSGSDSARSYSSSKNNNTTMTTAFLKQQQDCSLSSLADNLHQHHQQNMNNNDDDDNNNSSSVTTTPRLHQTTTPIIRKSPPNSTTHMINLDDMDPSMMPSPPPSSSNNNSDLMVTPSTIAASSAQSVRASVVLPGSGYVVDFHNPATTTSSLSSSSKTYRKHRRDNTADLQNTVKELQYLLSDAEVRRRELEHELEAREMIVAEAERTMRRHYEALDRRSRDMEQRIVSKNREHARTVASMQRKIEALLEERATVLHESSRRRQDHHRYPRGEQEEEEEEEEVDGDYTIEPSKGFVWDDDSDLLSELEKSRREPVSDPSLQSKMPCSNLDSHHHKQISYLTQQLRAAKLDLEEARKHHQELESEVESLRNQPPADEEVLARLAEAERRADALAQQLYAESVARKKAHNQVRELRGNIRVIARLRPKGVCGGRDTAPCSLQPYDKYTCELKVSARGHNASNQEDETRRYEFDACLPEGTTQEQVYDEVGDVVQSALDGYKVCVFAYGQTGSGKTHTMVGSDDAPGLLPRCARQMFAGGDSKGCVTVRCQIFELYQDNLVDLLAPADGGSESTSKLTVQHEPCTGDVFVKSAETVTCTDADALLDVCKKAFSRRATASTKMNAESSRSHLMLMFFTEHVAHNVNNVTYGKLTLVDLAGSERVKKSGAEGDRLDEARAINQSLSALGDVVSALTKGEKHIPYRNSRLTKLMRDSLGGQAKTLMIVNVSPLGEDSSETKNSLDYASRVKLVTNDVVKK